MNIKERIVAIRTNRDKSASVDFFNSNPKDLQQLIDVVARLEEYPFKEYGSWILTHIARSDVNHLQSYYPLLVDILFKTENQSVLRNVVNSISYLKITDYRESEFIDLLIQFIQNPKNKVALHVYSIYVLIQFVEKYPELKNEITQVILRNSKGKSVAYSVAQRNFFKRFPEK